jgi:DNA ligase-1
LNAALSFKRKFHIKKFKMPDTYSEGVEHADFMQLLNKLESRDITGNEAVKQVEELLAKCYEEQALWYSRVIKKDLRISVDVKLANKAGAQIPHFDVMLATDITKCNKVESIFESDCFISPKLDGYRCIAICENGNVSLMSRNGTEYENFPTIKNALIHIAKLGNYVLDGEIMSDNFNSMQQTAFASKRRTSVGDVVFHVFDILPLSEWSSKEFKLTKSARIAMLSEVLKNSPTNRVVEVAHKRVKSLDDAMQFHNAFVARGYEGGMVLPNIPYYLGRKANSLLKIKDMKSQDCTVVGTYEGTGRNKGKLGGLTVIQENGKRCDVGTGFNDRDRSDIWSGKEDVKGRIIEVKYQELSKDGVMRFPVFIRWRDAGDGVKR